MTIPDRHRSLCHDVWQTKGSVVNSHSRWWQIVRSFIMWSRLSITACPWNLIMAGTGTCSSSAYSDSALSNWKERRLGRLDFKCETTKGRCASLIIWKMFYQKIPIKHSTNFYKGFSDQWKFFTMKQTPENEESVFW